MSSLSQIGGPVVGFPSSAFASSCDLPRSRAYAIVASPPLPPLVPPRHSDGLGSEKAM